MLWDTTPVLAVRRSNSDCRHWSVWASSSLTCVFFAVDTSCMHDSTNQQVTAAQGAKVCAEEVPR